MMRHALDEFASYIDTRRDQVLENLDPKSVNAYVFLSKLFRERDVSKDQEFQSAFRSFYRLNAAGLTDAFKTEYFRTLENLRGSETIDLKALSGKFYLIPTRQGKNTLQFSFVTKLAHTVNVSYPIYDTEVAHAFEFTRPVSGNYQTRLNQLLEFYEGLREAYGAILKNRLMTQCILAFRTKFFAQAPQLDDVKVLDFIFWSAGKLIRKGQLS
ncbi:MAG: hypothetical protein ABSE93_06255 [Terriglobia bacterium]|jgi:hypothetical protein